MKYMLNNVTLYGYTQLNMGASFKLSIRVHFPRCLPVAAHFSPLSPTISWSFSLKPAPQSEQTCLRLFWLLFRGTSATAAIFSATTFTVNAVPDSIGARLAGPRGNTWLRYATLIRLERICPDSANSYRYDKVLFYVQ